MSSAREQAPIVSAPQDAISPRIVGIAHELAIELHPHKGRELRVDLDSDLDRDVGLDSLGRAELLLRLDREFKVRLRDSLIGDARCPRDLLEGVLAASPTLPPRPIGDSTRRVACGDRTNCSHDADRDAGRPRRGSRFEAPHPALAQR
jgi:acyl carrier protein